MKRNKKHTRRFAPSFIAPAGLILSLLIVGIAYRTLSIQVEDRSKDIKSLESKLFSRDEQLNRETAKWNSMKTPENLEKALRKNGLNFTTPTPDQIVHIRRDGTVIPSAAVVAATKKRIGKQAANR